MSYKQTLSNIYPKNVFPLALQPAPAWIAILGFIIVSAVLTLASAGLMRFVFPAGALIVSVFLYFRYPILYLGFNWWMWFLTPWVARIVDFRGAWDPQRTLIVAPYLVALVTFVTFVRHFPKSYKQGSLPLLLAFVGVFYGCLIGLINNTPVGVARSLLDWLTPLLFSFHLFINWRDYPSYRQNMQRTFLWGVLVTGAYGVVQYLVAPAWDRQWIINTELTTFGTPEPLGIRVFSTMNSVGPFASVMAAGLLLLFTSKAVLRLPAAVVGYLSFLLSLARTNWAAWLIGLTLMLGSLKARLQMRLIITVVVLAVCVVPLVTIEPFSEVITSRLQSLTNLENDVSANERVGIYEQNFDRALSNLIGNGLGSVWDFNESGQLEAVVVDSGILDTFFTLGWLGALPYIGGLILIIFSLFQYNEARFDPFMNTARAIGVSSFAQMVSGSAMLGLAGLVLWGFIGISMAGHRYYQHQYTTGMKGRAIK